MKGRWQRLLTYGFTVVLSLVVLCAGCGGDEVSDDEPGSPQDSAEALAAFGQCMRDNGVEGYPDPIIGDSDRIEFPADAGQFARVGDDVLAAAAAVCGPHIEDFAADYLEAISAETEERLRSFAQCMRSRGIDMPDPVSVDGGLPEFGDYEIDDPEAFQAAADDCSLVFE